MTKDELLRIAIKCKLIGTTNREGVYADALEKFAKLVSAAECEACAKVADEWSKRNDDVGAFICTAIRARSQS